MVSAGSGRNLALVVTASLELAMEPSLFTVLFSCIMLFPVAEQTRRRVVTRDMMTGLITSGWGVRLIGAVRV